MMKHGLHKFKFEVVEFCDELLLNEKEKYWADYFKAKEFGFSIKNQGVSNMATYIIHDLHYGTYYCRTGETGFCSNRKNAYPFYTVGEAKAALAALKRANPSGNKGCIFERY